MGQRDPKGLAKIHPKADAIAELISAAKTASLVLLEIDRRDGATSETAHRLRQAIITAEGTNHAQAQRNPGAHDD
jgi:hypothetical protein